MSMIVIGKAVLEDMPEVSKVFKTSRLHEFTYLPVLHTSAEDAAYFRDTVFKNNEVYVARSAQSSQIVGFIAFNREFVDHLYLLPEARRSGIGRRLLDLAQKSSNCLKLWTFQKNEAARYFYEKHGFQIVKETDGTGNEEKEPDFLMEWRK